MRDAARSHRSTIEPSASLEERGIEAQLQMMASRRPSGDMPGNSKARRRTRRRREPGSLSSVRTTPDDFHGIKATKAVQAVH
jgi:hypothetical protein